MKVNSNKDSVDLSQVSRSKNSGKSASVRGKGSDEASGASGASAIGGNAKVDISSEAKSLAAANSIAKSDDVDEAKIARVKAMINGGTYNVFAQLQVLTQSSVFGFSTDSVSASAISDAGNTLHLYVSGSSTLTAIGEDGVNYAASEPASLAILGTAIAVVLITVLGYISRYVFGKFFLQAAERFVEGIPGVRPVYKTVKEIISTFSAQKRDLFNKVVLVEFPHAGAWSMGFLTSRETGEVGQRLQAGVRAVF